MDAGATWKYTAGNLLYINTSFPPSSPTLYQIHNISILTLAYSPTTDLPQRAPCSTRVPRVFCDREALHPDQGLKTSQAKTPSPRPQANYSEYTNGERPLDRSAHRIHPHTSLSTGQPFPNHPTHCSKHSDPRRAAQINRIGASSFA